MLCAFKRSGDRLRAWVALADGDAAVSGFTRPTHYRQSEMWVDRVLSFILTPESLESVSTWEGYIYWRAWSRAVSDLFLSNLEEQTKHGWGSYCYA